MRTYAGLCALLLLPLALLLGSCSSAGKCLRGTAGCACKEGDSCEGSMVCNTTKRVCEASSCTKGEEGCACTATGSCRNSLECKSNKCVKTMGGGAGMSGKNDAGTKTDAGGTKSDAGTKPDAGTKRDAGSVNIDCSGTTFDAACKGYCMAFCQNESLLCTTSTCEPKDCDPDGMLYATCSDACGKDAACLRQLCTRQLDRTCEDFGYEDTMTHVYQAGCFYDDPDCVINPDFGCSDTCGATTNSQGLKVDGTLAKNGKCEDGGKNSTSAMCPRGTDCTDCGARMCVMTLGTCSNNGDCCGYYSQKSLCVTVNGAGVCLATCDDNGTCPSGQTCKTAQDAQMRAFHVCAN